MLLSCYKDHFKVIEKYKINIYPIENIIFFKTISWKKILLTKSYFYNKIFFNTFYKMN